MLRGTGGSAGDVGSPVAGKTGTTEHSSDAWFIGYTPKLTTAVWMGYAAERGSHGQLPRPHQRPGRHDTGAALAQLHVTGAGHRPAVHRVVPARVLLVGQILTPPGPESVQFPLGLGTTTTTAPPVTSTLPTPTTTPSPTTTPTGTTVPSTPATTVPPRTTTPTTTPTPIPTTTPAAAPG